MRGGEEVHRKNLLTISNIAFMYWITYQAQYYFSYLFSSNPKIGTILSSGIRFSITFIVIISHLLITKRKDISFKSSMRAKLIFALLLYSGISLLWTKGEIVSAAGYWIIMTAEVVTTFLLLKLGDFEKVCVKSIKGFVIGTFIMAIISLTSGIDSDGRLGSDELLHPNVLANQFSIAAFCCLFLFMFQDIKKRKKWIIFFGFFVYMITQVMSKTSILSFSISIILLIFFSRIQFKIKFLIASLFSIGALFVYQPLFMYLNAYTSAAGGKRLETLTGRTMIWNGTWERIKQNPIFGYGFHSFGDYGPQIADLPLESAHNEFLNIWFAFGIIGLIIVFLLYTSFFFKTLKGVWSTNKITPNTLGFLLMCYFFIRSLTEAHFAGTIFVLPILILLSEWEHFYRPQTESINIGVIQKESKITKRRFMVTR